MGKKATKKATAQLQKIFDCLGEHGGIIETNEPGTWWNLDLEVMFAADNTKDVQIGVFSVMEGDVIFDPLFQLSLTMDGGKISEVEINLCEETTMFGTTVVDADDMLHGFGSSEKDPYGLKARFSSFMDNMVENGPYLKNPKVVKSYSGDR